LLAENQELRHRLKEAEETLRAIGEGEVDAIVVTGSRGEQVFTLKGANQSYRLVLQTMSEGAVTTTATGNILFCNQRFAEMLKTPLERVIGASFFQFLAPEERAIMTDFFQVAGERGDRRESQLRTGNGSELPVHVSASPLITEEMRGVSLVITDLSERKKAEAALQAAHAELEIKVVERTDELQAAHNRIRHILETMGEAFLTLDREWRFTYLNQRALAYSEYGLAVHLGRTMWEVYPELAGTEVERFYRRAMEERVPVQFEVESRRIPGIWLEISAYPSDEGLTVLGHEITERKRAEELTRNSLREKETLLKEIHHRIKNNLQIVNALLGLQAHNVKPDNVLQVLKDSQARIKSIALVHEKLYKSDDLRYIDFADYLDNLAVGLARTYAADTRGIELAIEAEPVPLDIDIALPCSLIVNELVTNALKHAFPDGRSGEIRIFLKQEESGIHLRISDDGIGFPLDIDFHRTTSLGLQLVKSLAGQLNADLQMQSGEGTRVEVVVPHLPEKTMEA